MMLRVTNAVKDIRVGGVVNGHSSHTLEFYSRDLDGHRDVAFLEEDKKLLLTCTSE